jgi:hypothetical protein
MKGDVSPVVYIVLAIIIAIAILAILFMLGLGPFSSEGSASTCKSRILKACGKYEMSGDINAFKEVPSTCADTLGDASNTFNNCVSGNSDSCRNLCDWIKSGG